MDKEPDEIKKSTKKWFGIKKPHILRGEWASVALFVVGVAIAYFIIQSFLMRTYLVDGQSMETTLQNGDRLVIDKTPRTLARVTGHAYIPHRGDIIIFNQSGLSFGSNAQKQLIKRVVGLPGERIVVNDGVLKVYNKDFAGGFEPDKTGLYKIEAPTTVGSVDVTLGASEVFVCGDNRSNSEDSRYFGPVKADQIIGKLWLRFLPISKIEQY